MSTSVVGGPSHLTLKYCIQQSCGLHTASQARILKEPNVSGVDPASAQRLLERLDVFTDWDLQDCEVEAFEPR